MSKKTKNALLGRGWSSIRAERIIKQGYTVGKLQQKDDQELLKLELTLDEIASLRSGSRPSIPSETVMKLLHEAKRVCCICRTPNKPFIIHHIEKWADTYSHDESNLVVLCHDHHDDAHTTHELSTNLTPEHIRQHKKLWLEEVKSRDGKVISRSDDKLDYIMHKDRGEVQYKSDAFATIHETMDGLYQIGVIDKQTMRDFDVACLELAPLMLPEEIKALRERENVSQAIFALYMNVSRNLVSDWECGVRKPGGPALRLLHIVRKHGLTTLAA